METKDTLEIKKKVYNTPDLVEHGNLVEMTQGGATGPDDGLGGSTPGGIIYP